MRKEFLPGKHPTYLPFLYLLFAFIYFSLLLKLDLEIIQRIVFFYLLFPYITEVCQAVGHKG